MQTGVQAVQPPGLRSGRRDSRRPGCPSTRIAPRSALSRRGFLAGLGVLAGPERSLRFSAGSRRRRRSRRLEASRPLLGTWVRVVARDPDPAPRRRARSRTRSRRCARVDATDEHPPRGQPGRARERGRRAARGAASTRRCSTWSTAPARRPSARGGAYDPTILPLMRAFGFYGARGGDATTRATRELDAARARVDWRRVRDRPRRGHARPRARRAPGSTWARSARAGRWTCAVDGAARARRPPRPRRRGRKRLRAGRARRRRRRLVGRRVPPASRGALERVFTLRDAAVATSGNREQSRTARRRARGPPARRAARRTGRRAARARASSRARAPTPTPSPPWRSCSARDRLRGFAEARRLALHRVSAMSGWGRGHLDVRAGRRPSRDAQGTHRRPRDRAADPAADRGRGCRCSSTWAIRPSRSWRRATASCAARRSPRRIGTGVPLHATITGKVKPIDKRPHPTHVSAPGDRHRRDRRGRGAGVPRGSRVARAPGRGAARPHPRGRHRRPGRRGVPDLPQARRCPPGAQVDTLHRQRRRVRALPHRRLPHDAGAAARDRRGRAGDGAPRRRAAAC